MSLLRLKVVSKHHAAPGAILDGLMIFQYVLHHILLLSKIAAEKALKNFALFGVVIRARYANENLLGVYTLCSRCIDLVLKQ